METYGNSYRAVYDGEKFRPLKKVNLPKGAKVKVIVGETIWDLMESVGESPLTQISRKCWTMLEGERGFVIDTNVIIGAFFYNFESSSIEAEKGNS